MEIAWKTAAVVALSLCVTSAYTQSGTDSLAQGFANPPDSAKPRTWWHWTNGNVTQSGITKDLEWMRRSGIGGFQLVDVAAGSGQTVEPKINFSTPEWYDAVRHSAEEAKRLGLEMSIFSSAGWSIAGGPWVTPAMAMKRLVWSASSVDGPREFAGKLPAPPSNEGPVRDAPRGSWPETISTDPHFYADSAVIAYPTPQEESGIDSARPKVTASDGVIDAAALIDGSLATSVTVPAPQDGSPAWVQFDFAQPFTARALSLGSPQGIPVGKVLAGNDARDLHTILETPGPQGYHGALVRTFAFPAVTATVFRIELDGAPQAPAAVIHGAPIVPAKEFVLSEAIFFSGARVNRWEDKGAFGSLMDVYDVAPTPAVAPSAAIDRGEVLDLTGKVDQDGVLHWNVPPGKWTILRMGYSLTGAKNRPSVPAGSGLEVDKLSARYVQKYFEGYVDPIAKHLGTLIGPTVHYMTMDSLEAGMQNWTDEMIPQFQRRRGYDPRSFLPILTGKVVGSADISDRFLWDFRRTLADMYAEEFYGTMDNELHKRGMDAYAEASGVALEIPEDTLLNKSKVDIPMAEFWVRALHPESMYYFDVRGAASAAHAYGKPIVAAEAFTGGGYESPFTLKKIADYWFAQGVNRLVFHTSVEQPLDTKPGNTMVGTHINRNITWAEQASPFMKYVARVSYMLQQGGPVADIAYLLPEGAPSTMPFWGSGLDPAPPPGYDYDFINTDVLLNHAGVDPDGRIRVEQGVRYRLLVLPPTTLMTPEVIRKLRDLVASGATIVGPRPIASPSLSNFPNSDAEVRSLATDLWGDTDGVTKNEHRFAQGIVYSGLKLDEVLNRLNALPDCVSTGSLENLPVWIHRKTPDADIYFIANQADVPVHLQTRFRVAGKDVQIWHPMDGTTQPAAYSIGALTDERTGNRQPGLQPAAYSREPGFTIVPLDLAARESVFVVFRDAATAPSRTSSPPLETTLAIISGPWTLTFPPHLGAPPSIQMPQLASWTKNADPGIQFFSGTATYSTMIDVPASQLREGEHIFLNLGTVRDVAEVKVNNKSVGTAWAPPCQLDVTQALRPGSNQLEIAVTNEWTNRLIGDRALPLEERILSQPATPVWPGTVSIVSESGLLGPVTLTRLSAQ